MPSTRMPRRQTEPKYSIASMQPASESSSDSAAPQKKRDVRTRLPVRRGAIALHAQRPDFERGVRKHRGGQQVSLADEIRDERGFGFAIDLHRSADLLDHALIHNDDTIRDRQRFFLVMRD
jgi:hypothetical protein